MNTQKPVVRTRFAPSPTGFLHVGGLRTALYAYLLAKKHNGQFILRIEDTDKTREVPGAIDNIINTLSWAGIEFDEGPGKPGLCTTYIQSQRLPLYKKYAEQLVAQGDAYYCFCSAERLDQVRKEQQANHQPPAYDKHCRNLPAEEVAKRLANGEPHVIRMKIPREGEMTFTDTIRGIVSINYKAVDDQVIIKSDGYPTYHLAVVVDDHDMCISHVIRGEEWLPSTPKHLLLYRYLGWQAPVFAHLPLLLNPDRSKLSKRQGDVAVQDYKEKGYLAQALVNFIAFLGWNPGDEREFFSLQELIQEFSLERVGHAGAVFNVQKLQWLNQQYIMKTPTDQLYQLILPYLEKTTWSIPSQDYVYNVINIMKDRAVLLPDFVTLTEFFFLAPTSYDQATHAKCWNEDTKRHLTELEARYATLEPFTAQTTEASLRSYATELNISAGKLLLPLRLAVTGSGQGPSLFHAIEILGKQETQKRILSFLNYK
ncbi:MAG: Glutamate-tRNA ligase [candidate division TM6 bacterium GW2011_GWF2_38_10]|nr:MAG: Glutamate-tRNA ligase [candidate division TM6 bacterium GW2011_GWF2_38_10]